MMLKHDAREQVIAAAIDLRDAADSLSFTAPVTHVYNPLRYAWNAHHDYLKRIPKPGVRVVFLGMNPGPWGMAQTGVPFGEVAAVKNWIGISVPIQSPTVEHPKRPIAGFNCPKSEVSGRRLWGLFQQRFDGAAQFFEQHFVANYCPLVFMEASARNRTPDKLPVAEREPLVEICDRHLARLLKSLRPEYAVGVGAYAEKCLTRVLENCDVNVNIKIVRILHPSPASPAANKNWAQAATKELLAAGVWSAG